MAAPRAVVANASFISRYFWKGELEESTEILLVSDNSPHHENPCPRQPQPKGAAGWFGEGDTNLLEIWNSTQGPQAPACRHGSAGWGWQPCSAPHPATIGDIPRGKSPGRAPIAPLGTSRAGWMQWNCACRTAPSPLLLLWFLFCFVLLLSS